MNLILTAKGLMIHGMSTFVEEILRQWLDSYPDDSRGSTGFATYSKLKRALVMAGTGDFARDLLPYEHFQESHHSNTK